MASAGHYRKYAADCVRVAQQIQDPVDKATLMQMAEIWFGLAMKTEGAAALQSTPDVDREKRSNTRSK